MTSVNVRLNGAHVASLPLSDNEVTCVLVQRAKGAASENSWLSVHTPPFQSLADGDEVVVSITELQPSQEVVLERDGGIGTRATDTSRAIGFDVLVNGKRAWQARIRSSGGDTSVLIAFITCTGRPGSKPFLDLTVMNDSEQVQQDLKIGDEVTIRLVENDHVTAVLRPA